MFKNGLARRSLGVFALVLTPCSVLAQAPNVAPHSPTTEVELIGVTSIPGDALDMSGLTNTLPGNVPHNRLGSFGSGMDSLGKDDLYIACDDRGPGDGVAKFRCRLQTFRIKINPKSDKPVAVELVKTTLLSGLEGQPLVGWSGDFAPKDAHAPLRYDPEGIRVGPRGTYFICEEYGPSIDEFDAAGTMLRRLKVPSRFQCPKPGERVEDEMPPAGTSGRQPNHGFEGLALMSDRVTLIGALQRPLIQDGALGPAPDNKRIGTNARFLSLNTQTGATKEFVYHLDAPSNNVNDILARPDGSLLVLERDSKGGTDAKFKRVFAASFEGASDVSGIESLPTDRLPDGIVPMRKTQLIDFLAPTFGLAGASMPEKLETLCFGPTLEDGRQTLIVVSDNDMIGTKPSVFWVFAIGPSPKN